MNERPPEARWKTRLRPRKASSEGDGADGERHGEELAGGVEEQGDDGDEDEAGEQGRVGAIAGQVLADRDLQPAEAGEGDSDPDRGRAAAEEADDEGDDAGEDRQLGKGKRAPRRRGPVVAGCRLHKGQPEEIFTRHQPISIPSSP